MRLLFSIRDNRPASAGIKDEYYSMVQPMNGSRWRNLLL
jgi:hypothetical protein